VVRHFDRATVNCARPERWYEDASLAYHRGIGCGKVWQPGQRLAEEFDPRVLEIHHLLALVVNYARGLHLPKRWFFRVIFARLAGGVDAIMEDCEVATGALGARGRHAGLLGGVEPK